MSPKFALMLSSIALSVLGATVGTPTTCGGTSPHTHSKNSALHVSALVMAMTTRVAVCEEGGWGPTHDAHGPIYFGNLGWMFATWTMFRRADFPARMDHATPRQQAWTMARFASKYGWPDQRPGPNPCTGGY